LITHVAPEQTGVGFAIIALAGVAPIVIPESNETTSELAVKRYFERSKILAKKERFV
jgi:hypothetical protein